MRRVTKVAIGAAIAGFAWILFTSTLSMWLADRLAKDPEHHPAPGHETLFQIFWQAQIWIPWLGFLLAIVLGATAFLTRPRPAAADLTDAPPDLGVHGWHLQSTTAPPRIWPSLLAGVFAIPLSSMVGAAILIAVVAAGGILAGTFAFSTLRTDLVAAVGTPHGFLLLAVALEIALAVMTFRVGMRSPTPLRERLALISPRLRWWAWPVLAAATLAVHVVGILAVGSIIGEPPTDVLTRFDVLLKLSGAMAVVAVLAAGIAPGIAEELLFRGYVQTRFVERWGPVPAIGLTTLLFAVAHGDLFYAAFVVPTGLWLGWVGWCSGSVFPAMFCHAVNNSVLMAGAFLMRDTEQANTWIVWDAATIVSLIVSVLVLAVSIAALARHGRLPEPVPVQEVEPSEGTEA